MLTTQEKKRVEELVPRVMEIAERQMHRASELGSDLDEATLATLEYYCDHPESDLSPAAIFKMCLRRALSKRIRPSLPTNNLPE